MKARRPTSGPWRKALLAAGVLLAAGAWAQGTPAPQAGAASPASAAPADPAALAAQGRRVYTSLCARCHGLNLVSSGNGYDLRQFPRDAPERFRTSVLKGVRAMPAWESVLKPGDVDALWAYVGSVNGW